MKSFSLLLILFLFLTGCDSSKPQTRGAHQTSATVQIHPSFLHPYSDRFIPNEIALLTTGTILNPASENCAPDAETISSSLEITQIKDTDLISITVHHDDQKQPRQIIEAVLRSYNEHRRQQEINLAQNKLKALDEEITTQADLVLTRRKALASRIRSYGIPYFEEGGSGPTDEEMLENARKKLAALKTQRDLNKTRIAKLSELHGLDLINFAAGLDLPKNEVADLHKAHFEAISQREQMIAQGLGETHPEIITLDQKASTLLEQAHQEAVVLKAVLKTQLELLNRQTAKMDVMLAERDDERLELTVLHDSYNLAKASYEEAHEQLRELKTRQEDLRKGLDQPGQLFTIHGWE